MAYGDVVLRESPFWVDSGHSVGMLKFGCLFIRPGVTAFDAGLLVDDEPPFTVPRSSCRQTFFVLRRRIATAPTRPAPKSESVRASGTVPTTVKSAASLKNRALDPKFGRVPPPASQMLRGAPHGVGVVSQNGPSNELKELSISITYADCAEELPGPVTDKELRAAASA